MKKWMVALLSLGVVAQLHAGDVKWETDLPKALEKAKPDNRLVMVDFTVADPDGNPVFVDQHV